MKLEHALHMAAGEGEASYANNSRLQRKALLETKPLLKMAVRQVCKALVAPTPATMVVADLGCSVGANTLIFVSEVISAVAGVQHGNNKLGRPPMELQFFLNDLPGNDFNQLFQSLEQFTKSVAPSVRNFYISGLPGSYYTRLFPRQSVHLFHSSYCLHWRSQLIKDMNERMADKNRGNIYIAKSTPPSMVTLYQDQFAKDMSLFLELRHQELVPGGKMLLTFLGRKTDDVYDGDLSHLYALLSLALQSLVTEGFVEKGKLESFNLPVYGPSIDEVKAVVRRSELFDIGHIKLFESSWDPYDEQEDDHETFRSSLQSAKNVAKSVRAVTEPLLASHFGADVLDLLFERYLHVVDQRLLAEKMGNYSVIVMSLNKL